MALGQEVKDAANRVATVFADLQPSVVALLAKVNDSPDEAVLRDAITQLNSAADQGAALKTAIDSVLNTPPATPAA